MPAEPRTSLAGLTVLLVEDDEITRMIMEAVLADGGLTVRLAANGQEALDQLDEGGIDAVLMDCEMPVLNGLEATTRLRADARHKDLPVIAMSAHTGEAELDRCHEAGMDAHVAKPIDTDELFAALERCQDRRR